MKKCNNYWTKEKCQVVALLYNNRNEFRKNDASVYRTALNKKWLDDLCSHMNYINIYWNYDKCKNEALKYKHRNDFQKNSGSAYAYASRNKILNDICSHMIKIGSKEFRCVYVFEFDDNFAYVGLTYNIEIREEDHNRKGPIYNHISRTNSKYKLIQLTDYIKKDDAQRIEESTMIDYKNNGWKLLNTNRNSTLGGTTIFWTYEKCKEEALKYNYRTDFNKKSRGASSSARKNNWYDEICVHMIKRIFKKS